MMARPKKIPGRLDAKFDVAEGLAIFRFALSEDFHFDPGQYATLWLTHRGKTLPRPYSIASPPSDTRLLEFYINMVEEGKLTPSLWDPEVLRGLQNYHYETEVEFTGPHGRFVLDPNDGRDLVFLASGTGLAPFMSMIRKLNRDFQRDPDAFHPRRIYVVHGVAFSSHLGYREELEQLALETLRDPARKLALVYLPTVSRAHLEPSWTGLKGRAELLLEPEVGPVVTPLSLQNSLKSTLQTMLKPETHAVYVCGRPGTVDIVMQSLSAKGFKPDRDLKREKYYP